MGDGTEQAIPWLPDILSKEERMLVKDAALKLEHDTASAPAFAIALLEECNMHKEARAVNDMLQDMEPYRDLYEEQMKRLRLTE